MATMTDAHCVHCDAALAERELSEGWCDSCGKRLPGGARPTAPARVEAPAAPSGRGAWRALGIRTRASSPTFTLAHEGRGRIPAVHLDFYRLTVSAASRGLDEYLDGRWVVFAEWPERDPGFAPAGSIRVRIDRLGSTRRRITIRRPPS